MLVRHGHGHGHGILAAMYLQRDKYTVTVTVNGPLIAENNPTMHRTRRTHRYDMHPNTDDHQMRNNAMHAYTLMHLHTQTYDVNKLNNQLQRHAEECVHVHEIIRESNIPK